ncbi:MAG: DNA repair protein RecN [Bacteroidales bacterium]|nr:DNA repair protein RecN [Bacteroidales bacterium]
MLKHLSITNYALIEKTEIEFDSGMSVITGETGAGKSIMLGALGLLLGQRAETQVLYDKERKCIVEATFDIAAYGLKDIFEREDVEYDNLTIVRREILPTGKSRAFVNDTPVSVAFLKEIGQKLIDIHSQHQNLLLNDDSFHLNVVDATASTSSVLQRYGEMYKAYCQLLQRKSKMTAENDKMKQDYDYLLFQHNQLADAKLVENEDVELEKERDLLSHSEEIKGELSFAIENLNSENAVLSSLSAVSAHLLKIADFLPADADIVGRIESVRIELADLLQTMQQSADKVDFDPERFQIVEQRLDMIYSLLQKHRVQTVAELIALEQDMGTRLNQMNSFDAEIEQLNKEIGQQRAELTVVADELSAKRTAVFDQITSYICSQLHEMGMPNARFVVSHRKLTDFNASGNDEIRFLFAANKNGEPTDISRVASGGEMSRLMLSIKSLLSKSKGLPTIVFDEIDTGVSGEIADRMGKIMTEMSDNMQVIAITHLPQVAAKGNRHYRVYKEDTSDRTISKIVELDENERVTELAKMLSGSTVSNAALQNARELLQS